MQNENYGPVVVGGIGGSGTRVVAEILSELGFYMGNDLNISKDNLLYTLLFTRPKWYSKNRSKWKHIETGISLFHKLMLSHGKLRLSEFGFLFRAFFSMTFLGHNKIGSGKGLWPSKRIHKLIHSYKYDKSEYHRWGWKEPNSHLLIENLAGYFPDFKYIHVTRHGLDIAFNKNQQQLHNWASFYELKEPEFPEDVPRASLKYWIRANKKVRDLNKTIGKEKFLFINFEELCTFPENVIESMTTFLDISPNKAKYKKVACIPKLPSSSGSYKYEDIRQFDNVDLDTMIKLGYSIE